MSSVRMCDRCKTIFSENEEGWQTATMTTVEYDDNGSAVNVNIRQDLCPVCAVPTPHRRNKQEEKILELEQANDLLDKKIEEIKNIKTGV